MNKHYPWQATQWKSLWSRHQSGRLPHALLLTGKEGLGKKNSAVAFSAALLCRKTDELGIPCGNCHDCHLMAAGSHPDFFLIEPEAKGQHIKIDVIREVLEETSQSALQGGLRVFVIAEASAMNQNAANALLKTLEEPNPSVLFILTLNEGAYLPKTILSRCQRVLFSCPSHEEALAWLRTQKTQLNEDEMKLLLRLSENAPLKAMNLYQEGALIQQKALCEALHGLMIKKENPLALALKWHEGDVRFLLWLWLHVVRDVLRQQWVPTLSNSEYFIFLNEINKKVNLNSLVAFIDFLQKKYATILSSLNLNRQLLLEELFITWMDYVSG